MPALLILWWWWLSGEGLRYAVRREVCGSDERFS